MPSDITSPPITWADPDSRDPGDAHVHRTLAPACHALQQQQHLNMSGSRLQRGPRLLRAAKAGEVKIAALFGGQGLHNSQCLDELVHLHRTQNEHTSNLFQRAAYLLEQLATTTRASGFHDDWGFDLTHWLADPSSAPPKDYLALAPISFPLNTLLGLAHYCIACRRAASTPGQFRSALTSTVGYSQGVFVAAAIAISTSWNSFWEATEFVLRLSFGVGLESHLASPPSSISPAARKECIEQGHGQPSPMLSVVGLAGADVASIIQQSNDSLGKQSNDAVYHALEVSRDRHILAGSISSLWKLCLYLRRIRAPDGLDQDRVPFHERKPVIDLRFLPISAPFHSPHLAAIESIIMQSPNYLLPSMPPAGSRLLIHPVKLQTKMESPTESTHDLARALVRAVTVDRVEWQHVSQGLSQDIAYLLDFGPGRIGDLVLRNTLGSALSVVNMADGNGKNRSDTGAQIDFYSSEMPSPATQWRTKFGPRVTRAPDKGTSPREAIRKGPYSYVEAGAFQVETKMTKVFGTPPIMVPGMVPTTTHPDVVATIMQAGYHAELGGGGFSNEASFERAVRSLAAQVPPHRGVTCNIIYANPQTIAWQISCLRRLIREGIAISGITIGAGIPSDEAVAEYIEYMDLKHISFKPGSVSAIRRVVEIAQKYPHFPVGLQWTGGRAGGHHSSEDFHTAILKEYGHIRECDNIILIAGSGFGGGEDSLPYLSGEWSVAYGYSHMPFDGILIGSRMMVCKEAHTSPAAKRLIVETKGVSDAEWHHTYRNPVGGVVTIQSEMGQPIHMLATRGVMLWKDLDEKVFSLKDPATRLQYLRTHHEDIVARLIKDYAKPWFAVDAKGRIVRLEDMTYIEVLRRLYCLLYVRHQCRWIDPSYERLVQDYLKLVAERANCAALSCDRTSGDTFDAVIHSFANSLGRTADAVLHPQDVAILFALFRRRGQKPVPFVPALDEHFETWFKKDCLWQAEDLDAVVDQDVQRVSIIHGPVAAQYSTTDDESAVEILDKIHKHYATSFCESSEPASTSSALQQSIIDQSSLPQLRDFKVSTQNNVRRYEIPKNLRALSTASLWQHIAGTLPWLRAALIEDRMFGPAGWVTNPIRAAFTPQLGDIVAVGMTPHVDWEVQSVTLLSYRGQGTSGQRTPVIRISLQEQGTVLVTLSPRTAHTRPPVVQLTYTLDQDAAGSRLYVRNSTALSNHRAMQDFYRLIWAQNDSSLQNSSGLGSEFRSEPLTLTADRVQKYEDVIHRLSPCQIPTWKPTMPLSLDFCVVVAWEVLTKPLMVPVLECDFMRLLHQSVNIFQDPSMEPLRVGHTVCTVARITGLSTMPHGKRIEVTADVLRDEIAVVTIKTEFFVRGGGTGTKLPSYQSSQEPDMLFSVDTDVRKAILLSRNWLHLEDRSSKVDLYGLNLSFQLTSHKTYDMEGQITSLQVVGNVYALGASTIDPVQVGSVYFEREGDNVANVVMEFLSRHGTTRFARQTLSNPGWIEGEDSTISIAAPAQSGSYAAVSTDHNPIHVCPVFAQYAGLDGVVVHGMNTSAIVYRLVRNHEYLGF